jgi:hypothetical protein
VAEIMESHKLAIKLFAREGQDPANLPGEAIVPVFHSWIQSHAMKDHLLIDVADYAHVPDGPGTVLVSLEANLSTDRAQGRPGLLYVRKLPLPGDFGQRLRTVLATVLACAARLEAHPTLQGKVAFRTDEFLFRVHDRLLAPNTAETFEKVKPELEAVLRELYPTGQLTLEHQPSELTLFEVRIRNREAPALETLLARVHAPAVAAG